ncbi:hypothetical protein C8Q74DRAFT_1374123 [Fomes fomentarius]|nr:hypothetical protein C8Q74DRAFT_1374123 [Fomes fomentarius]
MASEMTFPISADAYTATDLSTRPSDPPPTTAPPAILPYPALTQVQLQRPPARSSTLILSPTKSLQIPLPGTFDDFSSGRRPAGQPEWHRAPAVTCLDLSGGDQPRADALGGTRVTPIAADGFHSQFPPLLMYVPSSFSNSRIQGSHGLSNRMSGRSPGRDEPYGSPSDQFSSLADRHPTTLVLLPPAQIEDIAPWDMILLFVLFDFVYPPTPCVHKPSFMAGVHSQREECGPLFFALVMSTVASTLVQVPRSYLSMEHHTVRKLVQTCHEASRHISVESYDPPTSMQVVIPYLLRLLLFCEGHDATQHAAFGEAAHNAVTLMIRMHEESSYEGPDLIECTKNSLESMLTIPNLSPAIQRIKCPSCSDDWSASETKTPCYHAECIPAPHPHGKTALVSGLNYVSRIFALLGEILVLTSGPPGPPQGQFLTARLEEVQALHSRISHIPPEYGGAGFRQAFTEVKDFFDNSNTSRANALNPFLVMQANLYVTQTLTCHFFSPWVRSRFRQQSLRFVIEQYRDELLTSLQGIVDEQRVAEDREAVVSDLSNILYRCVPLPAGSRSGQLLRYAIRVWSSGEHLPLAG